MEISSAKSQNTTWSRLWKQPSLLLEKMKLRLKVNKSDAPTTRYDVENIPLVFTVAARNHFQQLLRAEEERTPNEFWEDLKRVVLSEAKNHVPKKKKRQQPHSYRGFGIF